MTDSERHPGRAALAEAARRAHESSHNNELGVEDHARDALYIIEELCRRLLAAFPDEVTK